MSSEPVELSSAEPSPERAKHARKHPKSWRRPNGSGSVFPVVVPRKSGGQSLYFRASQRIVIGDKKVTVEAMAKTEKEALEKRDLKILRLRVEAGLLPLEDMPRLETGVLTVEKCVLDWLAERRNSSPALAANSYKMYDARIRNHIIPALGHIHVRTLTYQQLKEFFDTTLPAKNLGVSSIRQCHFVLKGALDFYLRDRIITAHPMVGLKPGERQGRTEGEKKELRRASKFINEYLLLEARKINEEARWFLALLGMRQGEVLGLSDDCFRTSGSGADRLRRVIVKQQLQRVNAEHGCGLVAGTGKFACGKSSSNCPKRVGVSGWALTKPKSDSGTREIVIPEAAWKMLMEQKNKQLALRKRSNFNPAPGPGLNHLLFTDAEGKPRYGQTDREQLVELLKNIANLPRTKTMTVHTLRAAATTRLLEGNAPKEDLITMMGWSAKNADAQIKTYSAADNAKLAAKTTVAYVDDFFNPKTQD